MLLHAPVVRGSPSDDLCTTRKCQQISVRREAPQYAIKSTHTMSHNYVPVAERAMRFWEWYATLPPCTRTDFPEFVRETSADTNEAIRDACETHRQYLTEQLEIRLSKLKLKSKKKRDKNPFVQS
jgi:hypothetical protein